MHTFMENFKLVPMKVFKVKYTAKKPPYTGEIYYQYVWTFDEMEIFEKFICSFEKHQPSTNIVWVHDFHQPSYFIRFDEPLKRGNGFLVKDDEESVEKLQTFYRENLPNKVGIQTRLRLVVGEIAEKKKRKSYAKLIYTVNQEPNPIEGELILSLNYELTKGGILINGRVQGEKEITEENEEDIIQLKKKNPKKNTQNFEKEVTDITYEFLTSSSGIKTN